MTLNGVNVEVSIENDSYGFIPYQLQMYLSYGDFLWTAENDISVESVTIAKWSIIITNRNASNKNIYWIYKLIDDCAPDPSETEQERLERIKKRECGIIEYLDYIFNKMGVANVKVVYSP